MQELTMLKIKSSSFFLIIDSSRNYFGSWNSIG